jgi:hypothetical protein
VTSRTSSMMCGTRSHDRRLGSDRRDNQLSRPAQRALATAGIVTYADLANWTRQEVADLHGVGSKTFVFLDPEMKARGVSFKP